MPHHPRRLPPHWAALLHTPPPLPPHATAPGAPPAPHGAAPAARPDRARLPLPGPCWPTGRPRSRPAPAIRPSRPGDCCSGHPPRRLLLRPAAPATAALVIRPGCSSVLGPAAAGRRPFPDPACADQYRSTSSW
ncbi:hypothetical protein BDA96_08G134000 [Sorghum bicolor]|uniref:Uncharacterized protein n=1 Tax=Sorghum bicolor TaxID=4558 RepID=A0A921QG08_SORBI|nr:hypothetical protein BDA96_08G134000 [Sorghum bicolor]